LKQIRIILLLLLFAVTVAGQTADVVRYSTKKDVLYIGNNETDAYRKERCNLDLYYPVNKTKFPTVVWFHGGGLESFQKEIPLQLQNRGIAVVGVNYRLSPRAKNPAYTEDAAEAVAWVFKHIDQFGGDPSQIYVAGHSAGAYLALMVGMDKSYLNKHGIDADRIKGLIPISAQTATHYTIRKERGLDMKVPVIDRYAPLTLVRANIPPMLLITGDRALELTSRYEENLYLLSLLKDAGNQKVRIYELPGFDHGSVMSPACSLLLEWIKHTK